MTRRQQFSLMLIMVALLALVLPYATPAASRSAASQPTPGASSEFHTWENYHWARARNPFTLPVGDNLTGEWDALLGPVVADWNRSTVLQLAVGAGRGCGPVNGTVQVCNGQYGATGWLGLATINLNGDHITDGLAQVNDTYLANYPRTEWRHVLCQEIAHTFGLHHQSEDGSSRNSCTDYYTNTGEGDTRSISPNQHDYEELVRIYGHNDGGGLPPATATPGATATPTSRPPASTATPTARPTLTPTPRPANTPTPRPANTPTPRPPAATPTPLPPLPPMPPTVPPDMQPDPSLCFVETGFCTSRLFFAYWNQYGGLRQQGLAISPLFFEVSRTNGQTYLVQYFERARFEWHPEAPEDYRVLLGLTGLDQFNDRYPDGVPTDAILGADAPLVALVEEPEWGILVHSHGLHAVYVKDHGNGERTITHVRRVGP